MRCGQSPYHIRIWVWGRRSEIALSDRCALWPRVVVAAPLCQAVCGVASEPAYPGARARTPCVSNIEQLPQVCSAMIVGGVDGERGLCSRLYGNPEPYNGLFSSIPNRD